jgi:excisionase family DNA binding protein
MVAAKNPPVAIVPAEPRSRRVITFDGRPIDQAVFAEIATGTLCAAIVYLKSQLARTTKTTATTTTVETPAQDRPTRKPLQFPAKDRDVLTADEVAAFLGVDRNTVYDYAARGVIPHQRLGKRVLFRRGALVSWLDSCKATSTRKG